MDVSDKIAMVHKYVEAFDKQDMSIIRQMYADDGVVADPVGPDPHRGIEAICALDEAGLAAGAKLHLSGTPRCAGNAVAFPFQIRMDSMVIEAIDVFEFNEDGEIASMKAYWGPETMQTTE